MPEKVSVGKIKANLLRPALTSHFEVQIKGPSGLTDGYLSANGLPGFSAGKQSKLNLLCSEAMLPGSAIATHENNTDFTGVTEKFAYRRLYDDRIDFTFYVDADNYIPIRFFETWIKFIVGESQTASEKPGSKLSSKDPNYFYRVKYPKEYIVPQGLKITKFERTHEGNILIYNFVNSYPIAVTSMPVSYEASSLLKCTVSFSYIRYYIESKDVKGTSDSGSRSSKGAADSPYTGAQLDNIEALDIEYTQALASGNNDRIEAADIAVTENLQRLQR